MGIIHICLINSHIYALMYAQKSALNIGNKFGGHVCAS